MVVFDEKFSPQPFDPLGDFESRTGKMTLTATADFCSPVDQCDDRRLEGSERNDLGIMTVEPENYHRRLGDAHTPICCESKEVNTNGETL